MNYTLVVLLCFAMIKAQAQDESGWADIELDAGIVGFGTYLGNTSSEEAIYQPAAFGTLVNLQLSRIKADKWGLWLGVIGSTSANTEGLENLWLSELESNHPNAFVSTDNINSISLTRTHLMAGVLKRKQIGSFNLNYGAGLGAARLSGIGSIEIQAKELGNNSRSAYTYDYGAYDAWSWSANLYSDIDVKIYRSGKLQWMAFFRASAMMHGQTGEMRVTVDPILSPRMSELLEDQGAAFHLDMNFGIRLRMVNIERWRMFKNKV